MTLTTLGYAFLGGLLPSLVWIYFLLKEDSRCPEPRTIITLTFIVGMAAVALAIPLEKWSCMRLALDPTVACILGKSTWQTLGFDAMVSWVLIEEVLKYAMAAIFILWRPAVDEAPDYVVYMVTVALGFAAAENILFILSPIADGQLISGILTGDMRFIGSTLLHVVASAAIGFALAFSHASGPRMRIIAGASGLILAIALHTIFNALMIVQGTSTTFTALFLVWVVAVIFLATFEVLKYFQYRNLPPNTCKP